MTAISLTSDFTFSNVVLIVDFKKKQNMETKAMKFGRGGDYSKDTGASSTLRRRRS